MDEKSSVLLSVLNAVRQALESGTPHIIVITQGTTSAVLPSLLTVDVDRAPANFSLPGVRIAA